MPKYNVGIGDDFPVDQPGRPPESEDRPERETVRETVRDESREDRRRRDYYRWGRSSFLFEATFILLAIYGVLHLANGYGPRGLLIAAAITFAIGLVRRIFWRSHRARREWRDERRRYRWESR
ncbi:hypothetical protein sos41_43400 [Alphaproteobacteria bacterium SO-S41]|nr:hypothetical protein sos41_43400 [Alphaproteobacteria bacterium SO-S41]